MISLIFLPFAFVYECLDIYFDYKDRKLKGEKRFKSTIVEYVFYYGKYVLALFLLIASIIAIRKNNLQDDISAEHGRLKKVKSTDEHPSVFIGNNEMGNMLQGFIGNDYPIDMFLVYNDNGEICIDATFRDSKGDVFATVINNEWMLTNTSGIDYNNDDSAFEVISGGRVVCQVLLINDTVHINGMLCDESGSCILCSNENGFYFPPKEKVKATQRFNLPPDFYAPPIFKYPRYKHLGERL